ncbi:PfkB family carbohydrate kinase [Saccharothrix sp. ST-888]|uniref:PfkB family carbohydrate kinase n=1 Tax=Saccharothrix sp. ST-888 TaxID=1427391 RepID=UPI000A8A9AF2|nr:PfkB family carbohydrate kinase [Saccharothrix sp. ST-888]
MPAASPKAPGATGTACRYFLDIVFLSATALADPERTMRRIAERGRARVVVATAGAEGAQLLLGDELTRLPAVPPPGPVVDSNGAGDAFAAGFLFGWLSGAAAVRSLRCRRRSPRLHRAGDEDRRHRPGRSAGPGGGVGVRAGGSTAPR